MLLRGFGWWLVVLAIFVSGCASAPSHDAPEITYLAITPGDFSIAVGMKRAFAVTSIDAKGRSSTETRAIRWSSSDESIATVDARGVATARGAGSVKILAQVGQGVVSASLNVIAADAFELKVEPSGATLDAGKTQQFTALRTWLGITEDVTSLVAWTSSNPGVVAIDERGMASGKAGGKVAIRAELVGRKASSAVDVPPTVASVVITPNNPLVEVGYPIVLVARATLSDGTTVDVTKTAVWRSGDDLVARIDGAGIARGMRVGVVPIRATYADVTATIELTVQATELDDAESRPGGYTD